ncbi:MAG: peptide deformylase [Clostridia bacterium]
MIKELMHDPIFLGQKSIAATAADLQTAEDLMETLIFHKESCVGMAANMIGVKKCIICFNDNGTYITMFNPEIITASHVYETEESCLSLLGGPRKTKRYKKIKVRYQTKDFKVRVKTFEGWTAQIIQHEIDHCNGVLI